MKRLRKVCFFCRAVVCTGKVSPCVERLVLRYFAVLYAAGRIICEEYREPDSPFSMGLTRGQFLSVFLVLVGAAFFVYAFKTRQTVQECTFYEPEKKDGKESSGKAV